jgi:transposase
VLLPAEQARPDVAAARTAWCEETRPALRPEDLVFVDECGIATDMARLYGRAAGGRRVTGAVPYGRWERVTVLGGLTLRGLEACMSIAGAADTPVMEAFVARVLVPVLRPGQVVILDNLSVHKAPAVRRLIEAAGCTLLFLPAYSPDFNPIEPAWSKLKALLRGLGARSVEALHAALGQVLDAITPADAHAYFRHCGYGR